MQQNTTNTMMEEQNIQEQVKDNLGNIVSEKREERRNAGWPSGRQWRKIRKEIRRSNKEVKDLFKNAGIDT